TSWYGGLPSDTPLQLGSPAEGTTRFGMTRKPGKRAPRQAREPRRVSIPRASTPAETRRSRRRRAGRGASFVVMRGGPSSSGDHLGRRVPAPRAPGSSPREPSSSLVSSAPPPAPPVAPELPLIPVMPVVLAADTTTSSKGGVTPRA